MQTLDLIRFEKSKAKEGEMWLKMISFPLDGITETDSAL